MQRALRACAPPPPAHHPRRAWCAANGAHRFAPLECLAPISSSQLCQHHFQPLSPRPPQAEVNIHIPDHAWRAGQGLRPYIRDAQRILSRAHEARSRAITQQRVDFLHLPVVDGSVTTDSAMHRLAEDCCERVLRGERMYIHCWGGHGRTGTLVATMLGRLYGLPYTGALRLTQAYHDARVYPQGVRSPQTPVQRAQVRRLLAMPSPTARARAGALMQQRAAAAAGGAAAEAAAAAEALAEEEGQQRAAERAAALHEALKQQQLLLQQRQELERQQAALQQRLDRQAALLQAQYREVYGALQQPPLTAPSAEAAAAAQQILGRSRSGNLPGALGVAAAAAAAVGGGGCGGGSGSGGSCGVGGGSSGVQGPATPARPAASPRGRFPGGATGSPSSMGSGGSSAAGRSASPSRPTTAARSASPARPPVAPVARSSSPARNSTFNAAAAAAASGRSASPARGGVSGTAPGLFPSAGARAASPARSVSPSRAVPAGAGARSRSASPARSAGALRAGGAAGAYGAPAVDAALQARLDAMTTIRKLPAYGGGGAGCGGIGTRY